MANVFEKITDAIAKAIAENAQAFERAAKDNAAKRPKLYKKPQDARDHAVTILEPDWTTLDACGFSEILSGYHNCSASRAVALCLQPRLKILDMKPLQYLCDDANRRLVCYLWSDQNRTSMYLALELAVKRNGFAFLNDAVPQAVRILHRSGLPELTSNDVTQFLEYLHSFETERANELYRLMGEKPVREVYEPIGLMQSSLAIPRGTKTGPV